MIKLSIRYALCLLAPAIVCGIVLIVIEWKRAWIITGLICAMTFSLTLMMWLARTKHDSDGPPGDTEV